MALPTYNRQNRRQSFQQLPKDAYVVIIKGAKEENNKNGKGTHLTIAFDIAEGEYAGFYQKQFDANTSEDKKWPNDAIFYLSVPVDGSPDYVWTNWNTFFADLEDSNNGFVFSGDMKTLKGKVVGGKFHNEQSQAPNGTVYDHTRLRWTCVAADVRNGKAGKLPQDKLIAASSQRPGPAASGAAVDENGFMYIPEGTEEEVPF